MLDALLPPPITVRSPSIHRACVKPSIRPSGMAPLLRWRSDLNKAAITSNFEARGWTPAESEEGWDILWASVGSIEQLFSHSSLIKLRPGQLVNHFPNHFELTHKDLLVKNVNRYRRRMRKAGVSVPALIPATFVLPQDYGLFVEEFKSQPGSSTFILKPSCKAQGKGIFLINKLHQVKQHITAGQAAGAGPAAAAAAKPSVPAVFLPDGKPGSSRSGSSAGSLPRGRPALEDYVASRYIDNPLLVLGGNKFDLRLYVLVPSFQPLVVYLASQGFARFTSVRYSREVAELDNQYVHLTNVAVQKGGTAYNSAHGNKWPLQDLRLHLEATRGATATQQLFARIQELVVHTLKAVQPVMIQDRHCFELYGFDVIIDDTLLPWLIEVNASPSMTSTTTADRLLKWQVIHDALSVLVPDTPADSSYPLNSSSSSSKHHRGSPTKTPTKRGAAAAAAQQQETRQYPAAAGCMQLIHHDGLVAAAAAAADKGRRPGKHKQLSNVDAGVGSPSATARKRIVLHG